MAHLHKKMKKGRPYYYVREIQRVNGKPKVVSQIYLGSVETIAARFKTGGGPAAQPISLRAEEFGSIFLAAEIERELDTIGIIDSIVPRAVRETGPSIGEFFFYAWVNRLIDPCSKSALEDWYKHTAIQHIRPVDVDQLTSQRYWAKWERVSEEAIRKIAEAIFTKVWQDQDREPDSVLFDTTNYFTYMASQTKSDLAQRGHNKEGRHNLRQVGVGLVIDRVTRLPMYYKEYAGNTHDSRFFSAVIDEVFGALAGFNATKQRLTVVFDKGMNSEDNIHAIDDHARIHFITTYSPFFVEDLASLDLKHFSPLTIRHNEKLRDTTDQIQAYRTKLDIWGKERTVIVTHNPTTARKREYTLEKKLESLREQLLEFRRSYREQRPHWRNPEAIQDRYARLCDELHIGSQYYVLDFGDLRRAPELSFRKDNYQIQKARALFGRNVIVTDNHDWTTDEIVQLSLDRAVVENAFRATKDTHHISVKPFYHWTDGKIRCHILTCVIALIAQRLIELKIETAGAPNKIIKTSGPMVIDDMRRLHSILAWYPSVKAATRMIEEPTKTQSEVLKAFGWKIESGGVLQKL